MVRQTLQLLLLPLALAACNGDAAEQDMSASTEEMAADGAIGGFAPAPPPPPPVAAPAPAMEARDVDVGFASGKTVAQGEMLPPQLPSGRGSSTAPSMIIRTGEAQVEVDSLEIGVRAVERAALALGGWIAQSSLSLGEQEHRQARLEVKIPSERWGELLSGLERIGELRQLSTGTEDVGEQFVDLTAQLENARRLEERYLQLLQTRTGSLEDLLSVERELARVRERIEMMQGRLRYLEQRVSISTLGVTLREPVDLLAVRPGEQPLRDAFRAAWRNFLGVIAGGIALLGGALPLAMLGGALVWGWRRSRRRA